MAYIIKLKLLGYMAKNFELTKRHYVYATDTAITVAVTNEAKSIKVKLWKSKLSSGLHKAREASVPLIPFSAPFGLDWVVYCNFLFISDSFI